MESIEYRLQSVDRLAKALPKFCMDTAWAVKLHFLRLPEGANQRWQSEEIGIVPPQLKVLPGQ